MIALNLPPYEMVRKSIGISPLKSVEIPMEFYISLPIPTQRLGQPGYAFFAGPTLRKTAQINAAASITYANPDRWWVIAPDNLSLLFYSVEPTSSFYKKPFSDTTIKDSGRPLTELVGLQKNLESNMTKLVPYFWENQTPAPELSSQTLNLLMEIIPKELVPRYEALAPDFFSWLKQS